MMLFGALNFFTFRSLKQKLHTSERLHAIVDYTVDGIITVDKGGHIQTFNPACEAMFGYKEDEVIGKNIKALLPLFQKNVIDLGNTKESLVKRVEIKGVKQSGEKFPVYLGLSKIPHGHKEAFTAVLRDISQQKEIESNLIKAKKAAEMVMKHKSDFLMNMSHELRTPLNGLFGMLELLLNTRLSAKQKHYVEIMHASNEKLLMLVDNIVDYIQLESGEISLSVSSFSLKDSIEDVREKIYTEADQKGLEFNIHIAPSVPERVVGDNIRIQQILVNLLNNAVKFTEAGKIELSIKGSSVKKDKVKLTFTIKDTGVGIAKAKHRRVFKAFEQVDASSTREKGGVGLGLAICKNLAEMMGGKITLNSAVKTGSVFTFAVVLPVKGR